MARPSDYTPEKGDDICARLSDGESLRSICKSSEMPDRATVFRWLRTHAIFRDQYARAKEESADAIVEEILDIADDGTNDWMEAINAEGEITGWKLNGEHVQRSRVRIDARKWIAGKLKPKKYGEKMTLSGDPAAPLVISISSKDNEL